MLNFLKSFFDRYFYDDEHYAALFILSIGIVILYFIGGIIAPVPVSYTHLTLPTSPHV